MARGTFRQRRRLIMRGLVKYDGDGRWAITNNGLDVLAERVDSLMGCIEGTPEDSELNRLSDVVDTVGR